MAYYNSKYKDYIKANGPDAIYFPKLKDTSLAYYFWIQSECGGMLRSIIHPLIRSFIIQKLQDGKLCWDYLLQDNFIFTASQRSTPVSVTLRVLQILCDSDMTVKPNQLLIQEKQIWYEEKVNKGELKLDLSQVDVTDTINTHAIEFDHCDCLTCYQKNHPEEEKERAWNNVRTFIQQTYHIIYPEYKDIKNGLFSNSIQQIIAYEQWLLLDNYTIEPCHNACDEASSIIDTVTELNEETIKQLFVLLRGMSHYETDRVKMVNKRQLQKYYSESQSKHANSLVEAHLDTYFDLIDTYEKDKKSTQCIELHNTNHERVNEINDELSLHTYHCSYENCMYSTTQLVDYNNHLAHHKNQLHNACNDTTCLTVCVTDDVVNDHKDQSNVSVDNVNQAQEGSNVSDVTLGNNESKLGNNNDVKLGNNEAKLGNTNDNINDNNDNNTITNTTTNDETHKLQMQQPIKDSIKLNTNQQLTTTDSTNNNASINTTDIIPTQQNKSDNKTSLDANKDLKSKTVKTYKCKKIDCLQSFTSAEDLDEHYRKDHPTFIPYVCSYPSCSFSTSFYTEFIKHVKVHKVKNTNRKQSRKSKKTMKAVNSKENSSETSHIKKKVKSNALSDDDYIQEDELKLQRKHNTNTTHHRIKKKRAASITMAELQSNTKDQHIIVELNPYEQTMYQAQQITQEAEQCNCKNNELFTTLWNEMPIDNIKEVATDEIHSPLENTQENELKRSLSTSDMLNIANNSILTDESIKLINTPDVLINDALYDQNEIILPIQSNSYDHISPNTINTLLTDEESLLLAPLTISKQNEDNSVNNPVESIMQVNSDETSHVPMGLSNLQENEFKSELYTNISNEKLPKRIEDETECQNEKRANSTNFNIQSTLSISSNEVDQHSEPVTEESIALPSISMVSSSLSPIPSYITYSFPVASNPGYSIHVCSPSLTMEQYENYVFCSLNNAVKVSIYENRHIDNTTNMTYKNDQLVAMNTNLVHKRTKKKNSRKHVPIYNSNEYSDVDSIREYRKRELF